jgi:hypothetical protein
LVLSHAPIAGPAIRIKASAAHFTAGAILSENEASLAGAFAKGVGFTHPRKWVLQPQEQLAGGCPIGDD